MWGGEREEAKKAKRKGEKEILYNFFFFDGLRVSVCVKSERTSRIECGQLPVPEEEGGGGEEETGGEEKRRERREVAGSKKKN